nr:hypothetical protein CPGR_00525 [Mycolicibacterium malmesburyense]
MSTARGTPTCWINLAKAVLGEAANASVTFIDPR